MYSQLHGNLDLTRKIGLDGGCCDCEHMRLLDNDRRHISPIRRLEERIHEEIRRSEKEREGERVREKRKDLEIKTKEEDINHQHELDIRNNTHQRE